MTSRFSSGIFLGVDDSFNSALVNSGNTLQSSFNYLQHSVRQWNIGSAYALSGLVQLLLHGLPDLGTFSSSKGSLQFMYWLKSQGNRGSQNNNIYVNCSVYDFVMAIAGCKRCMEQHSTVSFWL
jgi:hypothetical protein